MGVRFAISGLALLLFALHIAGTPRFELLDRVENYLYDARIRLTMPDTIDDRVVIIDIDEASQVEFGQWPWPRSTLAAIVDRLFDDYGVRVLGFDALFAEAESSPDQRIITKLRSLSDDPEFNAQLEAAVAASDNDQLFAEALIARNVVTGFVFKDALADNEPAETGTLPPPLIRAQEIAGVSVPFIEAAGFAGNLAAMQENALTGGFFDAPIVDSDGVFRRAPLVQEYDGNLYPSLALAVARVAMDDPPVGLAFAANKSRRMSGIDLESFKIGDRAIPVNERVAVFIPYRGRQGSFPFISAMDVYHGRVPQAQLEDKIALLGASAAGLLDLRSTPVGQRYIGVEAHANLVAGLLDGNIRQQPAWADGLEFLLLLIVGVLMALIFPRLKPVAALGFVGLLLAASLLGNLWLWSAQSLVIPLASLLSFILLAALLHVFYGFFVETRNKRQLSKVFGQYIPPALVEELDASGADVSLEGEARQMSVLFSDVRGFTTLSENLDARELTQLMNEFLTPITTVIQKNRGTIDKYMGDAVMAFWGAPLNDDAHAENAVSAGLDMMCAVEELSAEFKRKGWPPIAVGVGVATGVMNVGNMGSAFRIAYTVMGDTVNLGSRLEGLTKQYGVDMLVSEATAAAVPSIAFREIDRVRVKGKHRPVAIFEPVARIDEIGPEQQQKIDLFHHALADYRAQNWASAAKNLNQLKHLQDDLLYTVYLERIGRFMRQPPPDEWDGVFEHLTK